VRSASGQVAATKRRREGCLQLAPFHSPTLISKAKGTAIAVPFVLGRVDKKDAISLLFCKILFFRNSDILRCENR
jgi:hypothetical protein